MNKYLLALMLSIAAFGQETKGPDNAYESALISIKTLGTDGFTRLVKLLGVYNVRLTSDDQLRTILVYGPKDVVERVKRTAAELDRQGSEAAAGRNIELTLSFLRCSVHAPSEGASALPADLEPVARLLRTSTQYKYATLWDVIPMRIQEGRRSDHTAILPAWAMGKEAEEQNGTPPVAQLQINPEVVLTRDGTHIVRFNSIKIGLRIPRVTGSTVVKQVNYIDVNLSTSGDFKESQKTVIGKVSALDSDSAVFAVISLKVVD